MRKTMELVVCVLVLCLWVPPLSAEPRASQDFVGLFYECDALPSAATPVWDVLMANPADESLYASIVDGKLVLNTLVEGSVAYVLPGEWGADFFFASTGGSPNYDYPDPDNPFQTVAVDTGYTIEYSIEVVDSVAGRWGFTQYIGDGLHGALYDIQIFKDRIHCGGVPEDASTTLIYSGDMTGGQHKVRTVRYPGALDDPFNLPVVKIYVDGVLCYTGTKHIAYIYDNNILVTPAWNQDWLFMGTIAGSCRYHVKIDYIRMDFTGPYEPSDYEPQCGDLGYPIGDFNKDCVVDITDLQTLAQGWLMCTDPTNGSCIDCTDPVNAQYCL